MENELSIMVRRDELLARVMVHRERFIRSFKAVQKAYLESMKKYKVDLGKYAEGKIKGHPTEPLKPFDRIVDYDLYATMLEVAGEDILIQVGEENFRKLWLDQWSWMGVHKNIMAFYASNNADVADALTEYGGEGR